MSNIDLKFRAWNYHEMMNRTLFDRNWYSKDDKQIRVAMPEDVNKFPVMRFTTARDKNGVEIYESDIVRVPFHQSQYEVDDADYKDGYFIGVVSITASKGIVLNKVDQFITEDAMKPFEKRKYKRSLSFSPSNSFVLGNIHEDPELLQNSELH